MHLQHLRCVKVCVHMQVYSTFDVYNSLSLFVCLCVCLCVCWGVFVCRIYLCGIQVLELRLCPKTTQLIRDNSGEVSMEAMHP